MSFIGAARVNDPPSLDEAVRVNASLKDFGVAPLIFLFSFVKVWLIAAVNLKRNQSISPSIPHRKDMR